MKPGYLTTEFWVTLVTQFVSVLTVLGVVTAQNAGQLTDSATGIVTATFTLLTNAAAVIHYIRSRTALKLKGQP